MYASQLTLHLANVLDVVLPVRLKYHDFDNIYMRAEFTFTKKLMMLNFAIFFLCLSQGLDVEDLQPGQTLINLKFLLDMATSPKSSVGGCYQPLSDATNVRLQRVGNILQTKLKRILRTVEDHARDEDDIQGERPRRLMEENEWDMLEDCNVSHEASSLPPTPSLVTLLGHPPQPAMTGISSMASSIISSFFGAGRSSSSN